MSYQGINHHLPENLLQKFLKNLQGMDKIDIQT